MIAWGPVYVYLNTYQTQHPVLNGWMKQGSDDMKYHFFCLHNVKAAWIKHQDARAKGNILAP